MTTEDLLHDLRLIETRTENDITRRLRETRETLECEVREWRFEMNRLRDELAKTKDTLDYAGPMAAEWIDLCKMLGKGPHGDAETILEWARESIADAPVEQQEPERKRPYEASFGTQAYHGVIYPNGEYVKNSDATTPAPVDQRTPERRGEVAQPEDLRCGDIADVWAGDKIIFDASEVKTVTADNVWFRDQGYDSIPCTTRAGHEFRLIHRPTPAPVIAETIRQSEPGDTFEDRDGVVLEWDGIWLSYHDDSGGLGAVISAGQAEITYGPLTRSTAAPRGDYGKAEVPTEPRVTIDPAAYETMFSDQEFLQRLHNEITRNRLQGDPATARERTDQK